MTVFNDKDLYSRGLENYKKHKLDKSLDFFIEIKKKNLNTLKLISKIYVKKNDSDNSIRFLNKILRLDKKNLFALNLLGEMNKLKKDYTNAEKFYKKSISFDKNFIPAYFNLASLYEDKGELELAKDYYFKVVNIDRKNYAAYFNLQRLGENFISEETIKKINQELKFNKNLNDKNIAYGHFILAKNYRGKIEIKKEIKELSKGHQIFFNSDPMNKAAANYWLETVPKIVNKNFFFKSASKNQVNLLNIEPIFIFGIPRSGTTLVEAIITSGQDKIYNAGENFILQKALQNLQQNKKIYENDVSITIDVSFLKKKIITSYMENFSIKTKKFKFIDRTMTNFFFFRDLIAALSKC